MTTDPFTAPRTRSRRRVAAPWIGLGAAVVLMIAAMLYPVLSGVNVHVRWFPPLHAEWMPRVGPGTIAALVLGALAVRYAVALSARISWRVLLVAAFGGALLWMLSLAAVDGADGIGVILDTSYEYLRTAREATDVGALLREYIAHIPLDSVDNWPVHIAGHPPGAVLVFVLLVRLGLGSGLAAGLVVTVVAATTPVAVLLVLKRLGAEAAARKAAPFLVFGPAAIWMSVSADALFGAFAAWGLCALAWASTSRSPVVTAVWAIVAGLVLGYCVMLSYGLPLLGVLAVTILIVCRRWAPLPWAVGAAVLVVLVFAAGGFVWWDAYPVLVERYWAGVASNRPFGYWVWANLAALAFSAGPLVGAGIAVVLTRLRGVRSAVRDDLVVVSLVTAAVITVMLADLSQMSKAEVERIWLPFVPWLLAGTALLSARWRQWGLTGQIVFAVAVQHLLATGW